MATRQLKTLWYLAFNNEHKICIFWHLKFPLEKSMEKIMVRMNYLSFLIPPSCPPHVSLFEFWQNSVILQQVEDSCVTLGSGHEELWWNLWSNLFPHSISSF